MFRDIVETYLKQHPEERHRLKPLLDQLKDNDNLLDRRNFRGHLVASAVIFSPDRRRTLMVYHPTFKRWQQPGGHIDPTGESPLESAKREAEEETGVRIGRQLYQKNQQPLVPILLESHLIPASRKKDEPIHRHHAFWYGFVAKDLEFKTGDDVIEKVEWQPIEAITGLNLKRAVKRLKPLLELKA